MLRITPADGQPAPAFVTVQANNYPIPRYVRRDRKLYSIPAHGTLRLGLNDAGTHYDRVLLTEGVREVSREEIRQILVLASDMI